ncbi:hypothetical protein [Methylobacterium sp. Leaf361]|uniref:hypothetical protein n=1 Tax=Methylobacterium sp. Leaf361 TaxID=1736352 RepID=UPI000AAC36DE|nr:hypothetical protein [Methylobacterium sp. Leaf361]
MADEALAVLADRYKGGAINNTRVAIRKVRGTRCGYEISFDLEVVTLGEIYDREPITTCVVKWQTDGTSAVAVAASKERWPTSSEVFRQALRTSVTDDGICAWPFGNEGSKVRAVPLQVARTAFFVTSTWPTATMRPSGRRPPARCLSEPSKHASAAA